MKTGCTSGKKNFVFTFHSVCTVFVPFKMEHFQSSLIIRDLHNYKGVPYESHMNSNEFSMKPEGEERIVNGVYPLVFCNQVFV